MKEAPVKGNPKGMIAIDGPASSGKTTVAQRVARALGYLFLDTGAMYRAVTLAALRLGIDIEDEDAVSNLAGQLKIDIRPPSQSDGRHYDVLLDGRDVTWAIRQPEVDANVSRVSAYAGVRRAMTQRQREIGLRGGVVMAGRDIGTVVLPEADLKIYLDASVEERAKRRYGELKARGEEVEYAEILRSMKRRDQVDSTRQLAPLRRAPEAVYLDTTGKPIDQVVEEILELVRRAGLVEEAAEG
jgi:cytidylate kinase